MHLQPRFRPFVGLLALSTALWLAGCQNTPTTAEAESAPSTTSAPADTAENALDWAGTYQAILTCPSCVPRAISVQLRDDHTAVVRVRRLGDQPDATVTQTYRGPFRFDPTGSSLISLGQDPNAQPVYRFFVGENWIELRDRQTGDPLSNAYSFRLRKTAAPAP